MAKATLEFDLNDFYDNKKHRRCLNADKVYVTLNDIANEIFRPARKHGYYEENIQSALNNKDVDTFISLLEDKFYLLLEENGVNLGDLE